MSIILTAGKKCVKAKPKPKKKKQHKKPQPFNSVPPFSNPKTKVWYWPLDYVDTTVMFTPDKDELWCNGVYLDHMNGFADMDNSGGTVDFALRPGPIEHKSRIQRILMGKEMTYILLVDGYEVPEHTAENWAEQGSGGAFGFYQYPADDPPPYEEPPPAFDYLDNQDSVERSDDDSDTGNSVLLSQEEKKNV